MLQAVGKDIWHEQYRFSVFGIGISSRMTVVRLPDARLWLHSPVPLAAATRDQLAALGDVACIVAPNRFHHLYAGDCARQYPAATVFGAPGLAAKRPDLLLRTLGPRAEPEWEGALDQVFVEGVPLLNETVWLHRASRSLIVTDLCQYATGAMPLSGRLYMGAMGVYRHLAVPRSVRFAVKDRAALARSVRRILAWEFDRVLFAHNTILREGAHAAVQRAFEAVL